MARLCIDQRQASHPLRKKLSLLTKNNLLARLSMPAEETRSAQATYNPSRKRPRHGSQTAFSASSTQTYRASSHRTTLEPKLKYVKMTTRWSAGLKCITSSTISLSAPRSPKTLSRRSPRLRSRGPQSCSAHLLQLAKITT